MSDDGWRARIRWVVVHPDQPKVLPARRGGSLVLPEAERPGRPARGGGLAGRADLTAAGTDRVRHGGPYLHHGLVVALLDDLLVRRPLRAPAARLGPERSRALSEQAGNATRGSSPGGSGSASTTSSATGSPATRSRPSTWWPRTGTGCWASTGSTRGAASGATAGRPPTPTCPGRPAGGPPAAPAAGGGGPGQAPRRGQVDPGRGPGPGRGGGPGRARARAGAAARLPPAPVPPAG